jgi:hypothetical protein
LRRRCSSLLRRLGLLHRLGHTNGRYRPRDVVGLTQHGQYSLLSTCLLSTCHGILYCGTLY